MEAKSPIPIPTAAQYLSVLRVYLGNRYAASTVEAVLSQSERFLREVGVKPRYTRLDVMAFVNGMVNKGYRRRSINTILTGVRSLFHANGIPWPLDRRDMHLGLTEDDPDTPVLSIEDIARLIQGAKSARFPDLQITMLSTLYGLRNTELAAVITGGLDGRSLEVQPAKGGRRRVHSIPEPLSKALTFKGHTIGRDGVHKIFQRLMVRHVRPPSKREGFHAIRRALVTGLVEAGASEYTIFWFMGWHKKEMVWKYFHPNPRDIDREIFQVHPFYPLWLRP